MEVDGVSMVQADGATDTDVQPLKADPTTWTPWIPAASGNTVGDRVGPGAVFNSRARWTMGWQPRLATDGSGQLLDASYYMPTFNHSRTDHKTAAAGDGRDWNWSGEEADTSASPNGTNAGADATGVTHPGDGTDGYWNAGDTATSLLGTPPDTQSGTHYRVSNCRAGPTGHVAQSVECTPRRKPCRQLLGGRPANGLGLLGQYALSR